MEVLRRTSAIPILKIDELMVEQAVQTGKRIGVVVTFPPTLAITSELLNETAAALNISLDIVPSLGSDAYDAILAGDPDRHDRLLTAAVERLGAQQLDAIVLAQVSMTRILPGIESRIQVPVLSSLSSSLEAIQQLLQKSIWRDAQ